MKQADEKIYLTLYISLISFPCQISDWSPTSQFLHFRSFWTERFPVLWVESIREPQAEKNPGELPLEFGYRSPNNSGYDNEAKKRKWRLYLLTVNAGGVRWGWTQRRQCSWEGEHRERTCGDEATRDNVSAVASRNPKRFYLVEIYATRFRHLAKDLAWLKLRWTNTDSTTAHVIKGFVPATPADTNRLHQRRIDTL